MTDLLPAFQSLEPLGLPSALSAAWASSVSSERAGRLSPLLVREFQGLRDWAGAVDHAYLRSDAFRANVVQAVRAAELAESDVKLRLIARALAGCVLGFAAPAPDKFQTMRLLEGVSEREWAVFALALDRVDPLDPLGDVLPAEFSLPGFSRDEVTAGLLGLAQLGWVARVEGGWAFTVLARQVATLCRLGVVE